MGAHGRIRLKPLAIDEARGQPAFDEWSQKWPGYDAAETQRVWDSIHTTSGSQGWGSWRMPRRQIRQGLRML